MSMAILGDLLVASSNFHFVVVVVVVVAVVARYYCCHITIIIIIIPRFLLPSIVSKTRCFDLQSAAPLKFLYSRLR